MIGGQAGARCPGIPGDIEHERRVGLVAVRELRRPIATEHVEVRVLREDHSVRAMHASLRCAVAFL
jgi:hypothetical protein